MIDTTTAQASGESLDGVQGKEIAERTPSPWLLHYQPPDTQVGDGLDFSIQAVNGPVICLISESYQTPQQLRADLNFIIRACNAHDDMLAALEAVTAEWREGYGLRCKPQVDAAIAKARGQE